MHEKSFISVKASHLRCKSKLLPRKNICVHHINVERKALGCSHYGAIQRYVAWRILPQFLEKHQKWTDIAIEAIMTCAIFKLNLRSMLRVTPTSLVPV